jgi:sigma-B regulation protein RsbU (phosphoserine phosphatase)
MVRKSLSALLLVSAVVVAAGLLLSFLLVSRLVKPLQALSAGAARLGSGDLEVQVPGEGRDEIGRLVAVFNGMVAGLKQAEAVKLEKERISSELNIARGIQLDLLPKQAPQAAGLKVAFHCAPAKELGGDFYDWFSLPGGRLGFCIADVSGKGVPAALHMANLRNLVRFVAQGEPQPQEVLKRVNLLAGSDLKGQSFVTMIYLSYDPASGRGSLACAGHDPALILRAPSAKLEPLKPGGMPVGFAEPEIYDMVMTQADFQLAPGDRMALYTDGVTEAMDPQRAQFGMDRLCTSLQKGGDPEAMAEGLLKAVAGHAKGAEQSDDITVLILGRD